VHYVTKDNPPILIMHGTTDALVPFAQSVEFADALKAVGVEVTLPAPPRLGPWRAGFNLPAVRELSAIYGQASQRRQPDH